MRPAVRRLPDTSIVDTIITSYKSGVLDATAGSYISSLSLESVRSLVKNLRRTGSHPSSIQVLRALWSWESFRPVVLTTFADTAPKKSDARECQLLVEIELLLASDARDISKEISSRLSSIVKCAAAVCKHTQVSYSSYHGPLLVFLSRAAGQVNTQRARRAEMRILTHLMNVLNKPTSSALRCIVTILESDIRLKPGDEDSFLDTANQFACHYCQADDFPKLLEAVLTNMAQAKAHDRAAGFGRIVFNILRRADNESLSDLLVVMELVASDYGDICQRIVRAFLTIVDPGGHAASMSAERMKVYPSHVVAMFCLLRSASSEESKASVFKFLELILLDEDIRFDTSHAAPSSRTAGDVNLWRRTVLIESIRTPAMTSRCEAVVDFFESQMWCRKRKSQQWGQDMLFELFCWIPTCRELVLSSLLAGLTQESTPREVATSFCSVFERLSKTNSTQFLLREHSSTLLVWLAFIEQMSPDFDWRVISAIVPIAMATPTMNDALMNFLRKASSSCSRKLQRVACSGLLAIIAQDGVSPQSMSEVCGTLTIMLEVIDVYVHSHLVSLLKQFFHDRRSVSPEVSSLIAQVMQRLWVMGGGFSQEFEQLGAPVGPRCELDFTRCFEVVGGESVIHESFPLLLTFCAQMRSTVKQADSFFQTLVSYLGDMAGAVRDACFVKQSQAPVLSKMCFLSDLFETVLCVDSSTLQKLIAPYSVAIVVRDFLMLRQKTSGEDVQTNPSHKHDNVFSTVTAQEVASAGLHTVKIHDKMKRNLVTPQTCTVVLEELDALDAPVFLKRVVRAELMQGILSRTPELSRAQLAGSACMFDWERLLQQAMVCFAESSPWKFRETSWVSLKQQYSRGRDERTDEPIECSKKIRVVDHPVHDKATEKTSRTPGTSYKMQARAQLMPSITDIDNGSDHISSFFTATLTLVDDNEARKAMDESRIVRIADSARLSNRHSAMQLLLKLFSNDLVANAWDSLHTLMEASAVPRTGLSDLLLKTTDVTRGEHEVINEHDGIQVRALTDLAIAFRVEFDHSLSTAVTCSYLSLLSYFLGCLDASTPAASSSQRVVHTTILGLLQDYSIGAKVLRPMLKVLIESCETKHAIKFMADVLKWLGSDTCLLTSKYMYNEEEPTQLRVSEFDDDIVDEAIGWDREELHANEASVSVLAKRHGSSVDALVEPALDNCSSADVVLNVSSRLVDQRGGSVRSLCLNETEDCALLSILCALRLYERLLSADLERCRQSMRSGNVYRVCKELHFSRVVGALSDFFETPFAKITASEKPRWPQALLRKATDVVFLISEVCNTQLTCILLVLRNNRLAKESLHPLTAAITSALCLLYENSMVDNLLTSDLFPKRAGNKETVDVTIRNILGAMSSLCDERASEFRSFLQNISAKRAELSSFCSPRADNRNVGGSIQAEDQHPITPLTKRRRVRSRNKDVDGWLRNEGGEDNFADLEDFVVPLDADDLSRSKSDNEES